MSHPLPLSPSPDPAIIDILPGRRRWAASCMPEVSSAAMRHQPRNQSHAFARWLRETATLAERKLWSPLRRLRSFKFRRQHRIERYIVDFYCARVRLDVELDGEIHFTDEAQARDDRRTAFHRSHGIRIIRFRNQEVLENIQAVVDRIEEACLFLE